MSHAAQGRWLIVLGTGIGATTWAAVSGLSVHWQEVPAQGFVLGCIGLCGMYFHFRGNRRFVETVVALLQVLAFTIAYTVAMYAVCAVGRPLVDNRLAACDAAVGVHLPAVVAWVQRHPASRCFLELAYASVFPQTVLVLVILGLADRRRELHGFLVPFFIGLLTVLLVFALWPAAGPFARYGYDPSAVQARYLEHFQGFRNGTLTVISWQAAEGLVTFPSFHTAWALLLAYALRWNRWLFVPGMLLNLAVIASTMTTGWHYFVDVLGGVALAAASVAVFGAWGRAPQAWRQVTGTLLAFAGRRGRFGEIAVVPKPAATGPLLPE